MENVEYLKAPVDGKEPRRVVVLDYADLAQRNVRVSISIIAHSIFNRANFIRNEIIIIVYFLRHY
jgi:hypothetical protein